MAEVVIVMGDRAMLATSAEKVDDTAANAFDAPRHMYVARLNRLAYPIPLASWLNPRRKVPFAPTIWHGDYAHTLVIKSTLGLSPSMVERQVEDPEVRAVILYSYGAGTVHEKILETVLSKARTRNIPVFIVNPVNADYRAEYESAMRAMKLGAIPLNMTLSAALAKIEIALRLYQDNLTVLSAFMTDNYVGEIPTERSSAAARKNN
jgi:L-asparaginase/Glu-tRNA(Gln) amidotransferase subunit D